MKRRIAAAFVVLAAGAAAAVAYTAAARDREYRRLVAAGEAALAGGQTSVAIEAFSGAIALNPDSMLAHLKRGETYRRHGDLKAAFRDLRDASELDPSATRPLEQLGDVSLALEPPGPGRRALRRVRRSWTIGPRACSTSSRSPSTAPARPTLALRSVRRALALDDRLADAHYLAGLCLAAQGQAAERPQGPRAIRGLAAGVHPRPRSPGRPRIAAADGTSMPPSNSRRLPRSTAAVPPG